MRNAAATPLDPALPWFERFEEAFSAAAIAAGVERRALRIGEVGVRLEFAGSAMLDAYWPAFAPLADRDGGDPETVSICVWDTATTGVAPPALEWGPEPTALGTPVALYSGSEVMAIQDGGMPALTMARGSAGRAVHHVRNASEVSPLERAAPLRFGIHALLSPRGRHLIHAGAVGSDGRGMLLVGPAGAGKSTLSLACLAAGMEWAGDDYLVLDAAEREPRVHALHATAKLAPDTAAEVGLEDLARESAGPGEEKVALAIAGADGALVRSLSVEGILIPRIGGGRREAPAAVEARASAAFAALAPTTMVQPTSRGDGTMAAIARLVREVPAWRLELSRDHRRNAELVRGMLDG